MLATAAIATLIGVVLCAVIVAYLARRLGLPIRETLMWFGLLEVDVSMPPRTATERPTRGS